MPKFVIIDGNAIIHRAYHAIPPLTTKDGVVVNAVYGFTSMLIKTVNDLKPTHLAVTFDMAGGSHARLARFKEYKGTRVKADQALYDQIPLAHEVVRALDIPIYEKSGYEADDVIGTVTRQLIKEKFKGEIYIVTGDMDTLQLIDDDRVFVYTLRKGMSDVVIYNEDAVVERFGFGPKQMVDYKALRGDSSDNIPGVPGIGEKGATELIKRVGGIEEIYKKIDQLKELGFTDSVVKKLIEGKEKALMSKELSQIDCNVPDLKLSLDECHVHDFNREKLVPVFQKFEFISLLKRLPGLKGEIAGPAEEPAGRNLKSKISARGGSAFGGKNHKLAYSFQEIKNEKETEELIKKIKEARQFACRSITSTPDVYTSKFIGLIFVVGGEAFYVPQAIVGIDCNQSLREVFADPEIELVGHDLKQLIKVLSVSQSSPGPSTAVEGGREPSLPQRRGQGVKPRGGHAPLRGEDSLVANRLFDVMIASYLLNPGSRAHDIPSIILKVLGKDILPGAGQESLFGLDPKVFAYELFLLSQTATPLKQDLDKASNSGLFQKIEMPLVHVLAEMELNGVAVDLKKLTELSKEVNEEIKNVTAKIYQMAGAEFNISSPIQLREILFEKLGISVQGIKKGKTGLSTAAEQLEKMRGLHPIIDEIEIYREVCKLQNTYIDVLPKLINSKTNRIHTTFNQAITATGRLSSSDPNLQNIPVRTKLGKEIREAFIADGGNVLVSADYSQIELRIVASLAEDKKMIEIFEKGLDIHTATAAAIHGVPLDKVTKEMRRAAKEINFGILYGMGAYGLSWRAGISRDDAKNFIAKYFKEFYGVKKYIDNTLEFAKKEGFVETLFGRKRYIPELLSSNFQLRSGAERMAVNHPIQGTAADLMKMAMIRVNEMLDKHEWLTPTNRANTSDSPLVPGLAAVTPSPSRRGHPPASLREALRAGGEVSLASPPFQGGAGGGLPSVRLVLQVHDELVFEVKKELADEVGKLVKETMEKVATLRVPIEVHASQGKSWGQMQ